MKITKKSQIIQLYKEGYDIDSIEKKGFNRKYIRQVLKTINIPSKKTSSNNKNSKNNIDELKEIISLLERLPNLSSKIDININIKIETEKDNNNLKNQELINPVILIREIGSENLRKELSNYNLESLIKIAKTYTPDYNKKIYKKKDKNEIIDFIVERASKLAKVGQAFRVTNVISQE